MTKVYHFTHFNNLATIIQDGGLLSDSECARRRRSSTRSGNAEIKERRLRRLIERGIGMGGVVGDYVPFYYATRSPMLFSIKSGRVPGVEPDQDRIIYLVTSAESFAPPTFVVSDGNATSGLSNFYGTHEAIRSQVDWDVMGAIIWRNTDDDGDRMRRRMAELLVHRFVRWELIQELATRTPGAGSWRCWESFGRTTSPRSASDPAGITRRGAGASSTKRTYSLGCGQGTR